MTFDALASRVYGPVKGRNVRVVWHEGLLYVVRSATDVSVIQAEAPAKSGGMFKAATVEGAVTIQVPHCGSCRRRLELSAVGQMPQADILAFGAVDA